MKHSSTSNYGRVDIKNQSKREYRLFSRVQQINHEEVLPVNPPARITPLYHALSKNDLFEEIKIDGSSPPNSNSNNLSKNHNYNYSPPKPCPSFIKPLSIPDEYHETKIYYSFQRKKLNKAEIVEFFQQFGEVKNIFISRKKSGYTFGFIEFFQSTTVQNLINIGELTHYKKIKIKFRAVPVLHEKKKLSKDRRKDRDTQKRKKVSDLRNSLTTAQIIGAKLRVLMSDFDPYSEYKMRPLNNERLFKIIDLSHLENYGNKLVFKCS